MIIMIAPDKATEFPINIIPNPLDKSVLPLNIANPFKNAPIMVIVNPISAIPIDKNTNTVSTETFLILFMVLSSFIYSF